MDLYKFGYDLAKEQSEKKKASEEIYNSIEHDIDWDNERMMELENDHADELESAEDNDPIQD